MISVAIETKNSSFDFAGLLSLKEGLRSDGKEI